MHLSASSTRCNLTVLLSPYLILRHQCKTPLVLNQTLASEIEHHRAVAIKGSRETMVLMYVRYSTPRGRRGWRKRSGFSYVGWGREGLRWFDSEMMRIFHSL